MKIIKYIDEKKCNYYFIKTVGTKLVTGNYINMTI